jgi:hypothetical protein
MNYYALFHSAMSYDIIFWGNSPHSQKIFRLQKRTIRIITGRRSRDSCRNLFKQLGVLPLKSQYILSILLFVVKNKVYFITNYERHGVSTRQSKNFHVPSASTSIYQRGVEYSGVKLFNKLPTDLKECVDNVKKFKSLLKTYLTTLCFYSLDEFCSN